MISIPQVGEYLFIQLDLVASVEHLESLADTVNITIVQNKRCTGESDEDL